MFVICEAIGQLATSVGPSKDSVNHLNATMNDLVDILGPFDAAERGVHDVEHFFGRHRREHAAGDPERRLMRDQTPVSAVIRPDLTARVSKS
jgi:hypothetical protein